MTAAAPHQPIDTGPTAAMLPDGKRLHLNHGPIDLIVEGFGSREDIERGYRQATARFQTLLCELVDELALLRQPVDAKAAKPLGSVARAMHNATFAHAAGFITPMAAVAGVVADEILGALCAATKLNKAYVNNGGDIALHLVPGEHFRIGVAADTRPGRMAATATISAMDAVRGIATSGRHGRSHSLGIADAVTVFARNAAAADAAATIIANTVDLPGDPRITRQPARELAPDSDLGDRLVTVAVATLDLVSVSTALDSGESTAHRLRHKGLIEAAFLSLQSQQRIVGWPIDRTGRFASHSKNRTTNRIAHA